MDRRTLIKNTGMAGVIAAGIAPAVHAQPALRWRLASSFPKTLDTLFGCTEHFANRVKSLSDGKFVISVHPAGELVPAFGVLDAVQNGSVEASHTAPYYFIGKDECFALDCAIPFGMNSRQMTAWMLEGNGLRLMREFYAGYNIINFLGGNTGAQMGGWFRKEIKSLADLKGLRFRIAGFPGKIFERLGAVPQGIPSPEIYTALEKGTIDGAEFVGPYDDLKLGFNKVAPFYYYPGWWEGGPQLSFLFNDKAFNALPSEYQRFIEVASAETHLLMQAKYDARNPPALRKLVSQGAKLRPFPSDVMNAAFKASNELNGEIGSKNANWKKIYEDFAKFRAEQNMWFRFTEATFDRFMQAQKV